MDKKTSFRIQKFGKPVLRVRSKKITKREVQSREILSFIEKLEKKISLQKSGVGLAACQVGISKRVFVIDIKPTENRPKSKPFREVYINPEIVQNFGKKIPKWESCISIDGSIFAQVPRYTKLKVAYINKKGERLTKSLSGLQAHVFQHEIDHLNGTLFVDKVINTKSYMSEVEYRKMIKIKSKNKHKK